MLQNVSHSLRPSCCSTIVLILPSFTLQLKLSNIGPLFRDAKEQQGIYSHLSCYLAFSIHPPPPHTHILQWNPGSRNKKCEISSLARNWLPTQDLTYEEFYTLTARIIEGILNKEFKFLFKGISKKKKKSEIELHLNGYYWKSNV